LGVERQCIADDHAEALDGPRQLELTLLDFVEASQDLVPQIGRGQGRGRNEVGVGFRLFRLATLHRHSRPLRFRPCDRLWADRWSMQTIIGRDRLRSVAGQVLHRTVEAKY